MSGSGTGWWESEGVQDSASSTLRGQHGLPIATLGYQLAKRRDVPAGHSAGFVEARASVGTLSTLSTCMVALNIGDHVRIRALEWPDVV